MLEDEPLVTIRNLIRDEWATGDVVIPAPGALEWQDFSTGWYDRGSGGQQITVSNPTEDVVEGGETGYTAGTGDGGTANAVVGSCLVSCWPGTREECEGIGPNGEDVNPKSLAYAYAKEASRILRRYPDGPPGTEFNSLGTPGASREPDDEGPQIIYRWQMRAVYTYGERHERAPEVA